MEWTKTLDNVLKLDFDTVIPGHGPAGAKQNLGVPKLAGENSQPLSEFHWTPARLKSSLDGLVAEMR